MIHTSRVQFTLEIAILPVMFIKLTALLVCLLALAQFGRGETILIAVLKSKLLEGAALALP